MHMNTRRHVELKRSAFTLIEILVVMLIIGMVLGLAGLGVISHLEKAKVKTTQNQLRLLRQCVDSYYIDVQKYPQQLRDLVQNPGAGNKWGGPYVQDGVLPKDGWDNDFVFQTPGSDGRDYELYSYGKDGSPGGDGLNADIHHYLSNGD